MSQDRIIRIDAIGQNNFTLRFVGKNPATSFHVNPGDTIHFAAYYNNSKIDYQIVFKAQSRSPFTDVHVIDMPHGGVTGPLPVTTTLTGGMPFQIRIPSLGWGVDPEIVVEGATFQHGLQRLEDLMKDILAGLSAETARTPNSYVVKVHVAGNNFTFTGSNTNPLPVTPGDSIAWEISQDGQNAPDFTINFTAGSPPFSPLDGFENGIGPDYYNGTTAEVAGRLFRSRQNGEPSGKPFTYTIAMKTGSGATSSPRTITLQ